MKEIQVKKKRCMVIDQLNIGLDGEVYMYGVVIDIHVVPRAYWENDVTELYKTKQEAVKRARKLRKQKAYRK